MARTLAALERTRAPWLSVHLGFSAAEVFFDVHMTARSPALPRAELLANICRNVGALASAIPAPLILENLDYCPGGAYEHICEPAFIAAVLNETGAGLLLDLAHARVSAVAAGAADRGILGATAARSGAPAAHQRPAPARRRAVRRARAAAGGGLRAARMGAAAHEPLALTLEYNREEAELRAELARLRGLLGAS